MNRFNQKGMVVYPNPLKKERICTGKNIIVVKECFCPNGHNMISNQAVFNGFNGIVIKVRKDDKKGLVALSPVYGYKSRISLELQLQESEIYEFSCPECDTVLPSLAQCDCGGDIVTFFLDKSVNYSSCVGVCNRVGCGNSNICHGSELINSTLQKTI